MKNQEYSNYFTLNPMDNMLKPVCVWVVAYLSNNIKSKNQNDVKLSSLRKIDGIEYTEQLYILMRSTVQL